ncbi:MAG: tetratricopeptide repeat protein [Acidimicrobiales bacterium]|nr:tetratricopeptide repeat protein [Acidimicrobiales bacterium]
MNAPQTAARKLDLDDLAALEEQRTHLLQSLDDLDAELAAGDIDIDDYQALRDDYTARAAMVIRAIESKEARLSAAEGSSSWGRTALWVVGLGVLAVVAGIFVAQASGTRGVGEVGSGEIRLSVREQLFQASAANAQGDFARASELYTSVLEEQPSNTEALTFRGWISWQQGDVAAAEADLAAAVEVAPDDPAPRVFRSVIELREGRPASAADELRVWAANDPTAEQRQLVNGFRLREQIADALIQIALDEGSSPVPAFDFLADMQDALPGDPEAQAYRAWLQAQLPELLPDSRVLLDQILAALPNHPSSLVYRAHVLWQLDDLEGARADLAAYEAAGVPDPYLEDILDQTGLRTALN